MVEDIVLDTFPKSSGVYLFKVDEEVIYVGSSKNLYKRMVDHRVCIRQGWDHGHKQDLYRFLKANPFIVEFQLTDDYRQLEQKLVEKYNPKYNAIRAYTGLGPRKGRDAEYNKERYQKYKEEILGQKKQYYVSHNQQIKYYKKQYNNQLCYFNGETLTLCALRERFRKAGISHPVIEAKKYLIRSNDDQ